MSISLEMVVPGLLGFWADWHWGTLPLFLILGVFLGFAVGMRQLVALGKEHHSAKGLPPKTSGDDTAARPQRRADDSKRE